MLDGDSSTDREAEQSRRALCEPFHLVPPTVFSRNCLNCAFILIVMIAGILKTGTIERSGKMSGRRELERRR
jgi:hypothetical protein